MQSHAQFPLQGIGWLSRQREAASLDIPGRQLMAPFYTMSFKEAEQVSPDPFIAWLSDRQRIDPNQARSNYDQFLVQWKKSIEAGETVSWEHIGTWKLADRNIIEFKSDNTTGLQGQPIRAEKIVREHASHLVRVGEEHRSSEEMTALLSPKIPSISWERWVGIILLVLVVIFWIGYLWGRPLNPATFANPKIALGSLTIQNPPPL